MEGASSQDEEKAARRMEPPLRKKALKKPGSVLEILVAHARSQLDQSSKVEIGEDFIEDATSRVKLSSYFNIVVKPTLGNSLNQKRELHHLSLALDMLRQGDLPGLGDLLAARFIAIHQSVVDQSWSAARHMELLPYEEGSAVGPAIVLEARKHAQLANRVAHPDPWSWRSTGKGRGSRGQWTGWYDGDGAGETKGKSKKGQKGKTKGKGSWGNKGGSQADNVDGKTKEKIPEK